MECILPGPVKVASFRAYPWPLGANGEVPTVRIQIRLVVVGAEVVVVAHEALAVRDPAVSSGL